MEPKKNKKDQFVVVCADSAPTAAELLPTARHMSEHLHKGLILLTCAADGEQWVKEFDVPHVVMPGGDWKTIIDGLPVAFNAVLAITLCDAGASRRSFVHPKQLLKNFRDCKIAYLAIPPRFSDPDTHFSNTTLTIDHLRESKEKLIWASYMARFFGSKVAIRHFDYRDGALRMRWQNNMRYVDKVFGGLNLEYTAGVLAGSELGNPDIEAIKKEDVGLFITLVADQRDRDLGDLFVKRPELRVIENERLIPVLLLNQRDDLYVLCD